MRSFRVPIRNAHSERHATWETCNPLFLSGSNPLHSVMAPRHHVDTPYKLVGRDRSYNEPSDIGYLLNDVSFWELLQQKGFENFLRRCQTYDPNVIDRAKLTWRLDGMMVVGNITFEISANEIHAATGLPNSGIKLRRPVLPDDVRFSLGRGERLKRYAGGYDLDELNPFKSKLINFLKGFIHCNGHPNDKKFQLFHLHMTNHFKTEDAGFVQFDFCDWISRDFSDSMNKVRNGIRYDPSHGAIVFMIFLDAFNARARNARGLVPPHEFSEGDSNDDDDDESGDGDEGGNGGEGTSQGIHPQQSATRGRRAPTDRSTIPPGFDRGPGPSIRPRTHEFWLQDQPFQQYEAPCQPWIPPRNSTGLFEFDYEAYMENRERVPNTVRGSDMVRRPRYRDCDIVPIQSAYGLQGQNNNSPGRAALHSHGHHKGFLKSLKQKLHL